MLASPSGVFMRLSADEYKQALRVFYEHCDSHRLLAEFVEGHVLPQLDTAAASTGRRMLDVGAGDASLAEWLLPHFPGGVLAVDCNASLLLGKPADSSASGTAQPAADTLTPSSAGMGCEVAPASPGSTAGTAQVQRVVADFLQLELPPDCQFDLVLASHVLYQMPRHVIAAMLRKMRAHCAPGGRVLVALGAPRGLLYRLEAELLPSTVTSQTICSVLDDLGWRYSVTPARDERNSVQSEQDLRLVLRFIAEEASAGGQMGDPEGSAASGAEMGDPEGSAPEAAELPTAAASAAQQAALIDRYVTEWPRGKDGSYLLHEDEDFILIS